jgi:flagellar basal body-associated protein FliL
VPNSIIDDVIKDQIPNDNSKNNKKGSGLKIVIIFLLIVLIILAVFAMVYLKLSSKISPKVEFFEYLRKNNIASILESNTYDELYEKMQNSSSETTSQVNISVGGTLASNIDDIELGFTVDVSPEDKKMYFNSTLNYANIDIADVDLLATEDSIAIKEDEIVSEYVGSKYTNLGRVISQILGEEYDENEIFDSIDIEDIIEKNVAQKIDISEDVFDKYISILEENVDDIAFSSKDVILKKENENVNVTEYTMTISESKMAEIIEKMLETFKNDDELLLLLTYGVEDFGITSDEVSEYVQKIQDTLEKIEIDDARNYTIKVYASNGQTIKVTMELADMYVIDFEYEYGSNENSVLITCASYDDETGFSINITKTNVDSAENIQVVFDVLSLEIKDSDLDEYNLTNYDLNQIAEAVFSSKVVKSGSTYKLTNKASLSFSLFNFDVESNSTVSFKDVEIEDLTNENCLFMDTLDTDTFNDVVEAIEAKINEVMLLKFNNIGSNASNNTLVEQPVIEENDEDAKEEAKNLIIKYVSEAMTEAVNNGETYTLADLEDLEIPDVDFSVSINDTIAVITINGYEFTLDSDFNLSE